MENLIVELRRKQVAAANEAREINKLRAERDLTDAENQELTRLASEVERLQSAIETEERMSVSPAGQVSGSVDAPLIGMSDGDLRQFSLLRAIRALATGDWRNAGLEREASDATAKRLGKTPQGFFLPYDWLRSEHSNPEHRAITTSTGSSLIPTQKLGFIDVLRNRMMVRAAGAVVLDGLIGNVDLPRRTAGATLRGWRRAALRALRRHRRLTRCSCAPRPAAPTSTSIARCSIRRALILRCWCVTTWRLPYSLASIMRRCTATERAMRQRASQAPAGSGWSMQAARHRQAQISMARR